MSAESPRRFTRPNGNAVRPQPVSDKSVMESVVDFFQDVAYNSQSDDKEKILWVQFEQADVNDTNSNPSGGFSAGSPSPLLLILGYVNGIHIWMIPSSGEAQEVMSLRQGPVRLVRFLVNPTPVSDAQDMFSAKRPLVIICDASSAGQPYCSAKFLSLRTGDEVHHIPYTEPVIDIKANDRVVVVAFEEKLIVYDACRFRERFTITACYSAKELSNMVNPIALGSRWLAYADKKLVAVHQSCGGMVGDNNQSYTATIINAAKTLTKGLSMISETVANSLTGNKPPYGSSSGGGTGGNQVSKKTVGSIEASGCRPGVVTVVDVQSVVDPQVMVQEDSDGVGLVAHFVAHANGHPISTLAFDRSGILLFTADSLGHSFNIFKVMSHPLSCALGAVHHLYTLYRGDTTAKIQSVDFTSDSRWVAVTTLRGTTHVFPITTYGGPVNVRTHTSSRVVNRASRFHRSAGLEDMDVHLSGRDSPVCTPGSPSSSPGRTGRHGFTHERNTNQPTTQSFTIGNANNPRLPPYPNPVLVTPVAQIRQNLAIPGLGGGASSGTTAAAGSSRARSSAGQGAAALECVCVAACFAPSRGYFAGTPPGPPDDKRIVDSLFIINWTGSLMEYLLEPHAKAGEKVIDESPVAMTASPRAQWPLGRSISSPEVKLPLPCNNPLILACDAVSTHKTNVQQSLCQGQGQTLRDRQSGSDSSAEENDEQWLSQEQPAVNVRRYEASEINQDFSALAIVEDEQGHIFLPHRKFARVEIVTHAGPHRRLWMGPQFLFKTFQNDGGSAALSSSSPVLLSDCKETPMSLTDVDADLSSLCLASRSSPMDVACGGSRRSQDGATVVADTCGSLPYATVIEAADSGSFGQSPGLLETRFGFADVGSHCASGMMPESLEDQLRQHLADAMTESPQKEFLENANELAHLNQLAQCSGKTRSYLVHSSPPHSIDQLLVFPGDPPSPSSD